MKKLWEMSIGAMVCAMSTGIAATPALAQVEQGTEAAEGDEEIIVTATRRAANIQDIPIAISAFSGDQLAASGIVNVRDLNQIAPSLHISSGSSASGSTIIRIRGIGTGSPSAGFEGAVGTFVDGVYRSRAGQVLNDLVDVERVEVLRGPQGTLYGKNTSAGAINVLTRQPSFDFGGEISATYANYDQRMVSGHVTGPVAGDQLAFRVTGALNKRDGTLRDIDSGERYNDRNNWMLRGQLLFKPSDAVSLRVVADLSENDEVCCAAVYHYVGAIGPVLESLFDAYQPESFSESERQVALNFAPSEKIKDRGISAELVWDLGGVSLTSVSAARKYRVRRSLDPDHSNAPLLLPLAERQTIENLSQELRFSGEAFEGKLDWLAGGYFYREVITKNDELLYDTGGGLYAATLAQLFLGNAALAGSPDLYPGRGIRSDQRQVARGLALFTHNIWHVTDRVNLTAGLRYSRERKSARNIVNGAAIGSFVNDGAFCATPYGQIVLDRIACGGVSWNRGRTEDAWTWTAVVDYTPADDINLYASYSRGYKAGGFNLDRQSLHRDSAFNGGNLLDTVAFGPEKVDAYEIGLKSQFFDRDLTLNLALFWEDYLGFQQQVFNGVFFKVSNLDAIVSRGFELEGSLRLAEGVRTRFGVSYADSYFAYDDPQANIRKGTRLSNAPDWQANIGLNVDREISASGLRATFDANLSYTGDIILFTGSFGNQTGLRQNGFILGNLQVGLRSRDDSIGISLWGRNLTNKTYKLTGFPAVYQSFNGSALDSVSVYLGDPRTYGLTASFRF